MHAMRLNRSVAMRAEPYLFTEADGAGTVTTYTIRTCTTLAEPYCFAEAGGIGTELTGSNFNGTVTGVGTCTTLAEPYFFTGEGGVGTELACFHI